MNKKWLIHLSLRYVLLLILGIFISVFYAVFTPLTLYPVLFILKLIYGASLSSIGQNTFLINSFSITLVPACIAGAAYYLLLIFNLTTPMKPRSRARSLLFLLISFLLVNVIRIAVFSVLAVNAYSNFDQIHLLTWYLGSTLFIVILWFANVYLFKIKSIPVYTDIRSIIALIRRR